MQARAGRGGLGWHRLAVALAVTQGLLLVGAVAACAALGLDVRWQGAGVPLAVAVAALVAGTAWSRGGGNSPLRWMIPDGLIVFALVVTLCLFSLPAQYAGAALNRPLIDPTLAAMDATLGVHVPSVAAWTRSQPALASTLALAYDTFGLQVLVAAPTLVLLGNRFHLWEFAWHLHVCLLVTLACFALFPAACAFNYYGFVSTLPQDVFTAHLTGFRSGALRTIDFHDVTGLVSAPSFHVAGAMLITWAARARWWALAPLALVNALLCAATVLTGAHYLVDTLMSVALFGVSLAAWHAWGKTWLPELAGPRPVAAPGPPAGAPLRGA